MPKTLSKFTNTIPNKIADTIAPKASIKKSFLGLNFSFEIVFLMIIYNYFCLDFNLILSVLLCNLLFLNV